ncbi:MAG: hypothetical protein L6243_02770 [Candidatus Altiarchaeales archaeon]|nr:hypothetical protein [Candidatus Altiarchaeota archaeon]MBU4341248.1 hypothetical protein [Candidatus Altiarchaeota archaeon]MCG2782489.1 hypothetical protein [Candidatus Altiarchaeales archaeon]
MAKTNSLEKKKGKEEMLGTAKGSGTTYSCLYSTVRTAGTRYATTKSPGTTHSTVKDRAKTTKEGGGSK